jgi:hypothetical protein
MRASAAILIFLSFISLSARAASDWVLDEQMHLLQRGGLEWDEYRDRPSSGPSYNSSITGQTNATEWTLFIRQRDVKLVWWLKLNERTFTNLFQSEDDLVNAFALPAGILNGGKNPYSISCSGGGDTDQIEVGEIRIDRRPFKTVFSEGSVKVRVTEQGRPTPCRLTVVDQHGSLFPILVNATHAAVRPGVAYLGDGEGVINLPVGRYVFYAGRGFEYSVRTQRVSIVRGKQLSVDFDLEREVDTKGFVASDTHVHTFTWSRHGDATEQERAITLAGEGIELPIATDHNIVIDPVAPARATGMDRFYTPVFGDEVTTGHAHFNIFPVQPGAKPPNYQINDWPDLMKEMRATPGVKVVILNHPRNIHNRFQPFAATNFNAKTGQNLRGPEFSFDGVEVVNSSALQSDWMLNFHDYMALLNYGYKVTAVGSSDVHDVSRYIVGQGRTYIESDDRDPAHIDVARACDNFLRHRALVSMGLLANMKIDDHYSVGDLATNLQKTVKVVATVQGPSWTAVDRIQLFANGAILRDERFAPIYKPGEKKRIEWSIPKPAGDAHLMLIASGPPVTAPYWRIPKPYQPTSTAWNPRVVGATNPIWLDCDGDGKFTPPRLQPGK